MASEVPEQVEAALANERSGELLEASVTGADMRATRSPGRRAQASAAPRVHTSALHARFLRSQDEHSAAKGPGALHDAFVRTCTAEPVDCSCADWASRSALSTGRRAF